jgi:hypothetical protein
VKEEVLGDLIKDERVVVQTEDHWKQQQKTKSPQCPSAPDNGETMQLKDDDKETRRQGGG